MMHTTEWALETLVSEALILLCDYNGTLAKRKESVSFVNELEYLNALKFRYFNYTEVTEYFILTPHTSIQN